MVGTLYKRPERTAVRHTKNRIENKWLRDIITSCGHTDDSENGKTKKTDNDITFRLLE